MASVSSSRDVGPRDAHRRACGLAGWWPCRRRCRTRLRTGRRSTGRAAIRGTRPRCGEVRGLGGRPAAELEVAVPDDAEPEHAPRTASGPCGSSARPLGCSITYGRPGRVERCAGGRRSRSGVGAAPALGPVGAHGQGALRPGTAGRRATNAYARISPGGDQTRRSRSRASPAVLREAGSWAGRRCRRRPRRTRHGGSPCLRRRRRRTASSARGRGPHSPDVGGLSHAGRSPVLLRMLVGKGGPASLA